MSDKNNISINTMSILWILAGVIFIFFMLILMNNIDKKRKYGQYKKITSSIKESVYTRKLNVILENFKVNNTNSYDEIIDLLRNIANEHKEINYIWLIVDNKDNYYEFRNYNEDCYQQDYKKLNLSPEEYKIMEIFKQNSDDTVNGLFDLFKNKKEIFCALQLGINYLFAVYYID